MEKRNNGYNGFDLGFEKDLGRKNLDTGMGWGHHWSLFWKRQQINVKSLAALEEFRLCC